MEEGKRNEVGREEEEKEEVKGLVELDHAR